MTLGHSVDPLFGEIPERVQLGQAPLVRVLGQVTYPRMAKILHEASISGFQDAIYEHYPVLRLDEMHEIGLAATRNNFAPKQSTSPIWRFFDTNEIYRVSLGPDSIALETLIYLSRDDFLSRFNFILKSLFETINPHQVDRVGMRYVNRLENVESLSNFIRPELLNMTQPNLIKHIDFSMTQMNGATREGQVVIHYGIIPPNVSHDHDIMVPSDRKSWILDVDSSTAACSGNLFDSRLLEVLDSLASRAYAVFRWATTPDLLDHFGGN